MSLVLGPASTKEIGYAMDRYTAAKHAASASKAGEKKPHTDDMIYWEQKMLAAGAISLNCAAPPSWWMSPGSKKWADQREAAARSVAFMEALGLPNVK